MDWFLYDRDLSQERSNFNNFISNFIKVARVVDLTTQATLKIAMKNHVQIFTF